MTLKLIGVKNNLGVGVHFSNVTAELEKARCAFEIVDIAEPGQAQRSADQSQDQDINICFVAANTHECFRGQNIHWIVFESTRIADHILKVLRPADQVWVPSDWGRQILLQHQIPDSKISVMPEGVSAVYQPGDPKPGPFRFLFLGKLEQRKSLEETVAAWRQAWGNDPEVELVIKTNYFANQEQKIAYLKQLTQGLTNVQILWGETDSTVDLYQQCHAFVMPSKGEAWGLPIIEAAASGLPIITTNYSGHTQYLQHITSSCCFVDFVLAPVTCPEYQTYYPSDTRDWGQWAWPTVDSIAQAMHTVRANYTDLRREAILNSRTIHEKFSWAKCTTKVLKKLG